MLKDFKENPVDTVQGSKLLYIEDYNTSIVKNVQTGEEFTLHLPKSNVLIYETEDGTRIAARPSGTEPKVKFYVFTRLEAAESQDASAADIKLSDRLRAIEEDVRDFARLHS